MYIIYIQKWSAESKFRWFMTGVLHFLSLLLVIITFPFSLYFVLKRCQEYERAVVLGSTLTEVLFMYNVLTFYISYLLQGNSPRTRPGLYSSFPWESSHYRYQNKGGNIDNTCLDSPHLLSGVRGSQPADPDHGLSHTHCGCRGVLQVGLRIMICFGWVFCF